MPVKTDFSNWNTHHWNNSRVEVVPGQPLIQQVCRECGRGFVDEFSTDKRYAVHVSVFVFHRLSDKVTSRWLSEKCPGERLKGDEADRQTRFLRSAVNENANEGRDSGSPPNRKLS
jgi:hypothetical protein